MGTEVIRRIRNKEYLYYVYYDNKKRKEVCCGVPSDPRSTKRLKDAKIADLQKQKERITIEIRDLKNKEMVTGNKK